MSTPDLSTPQGIAAFLATCAAFAPLDASQRLSLARAAEVSDKGGNEVIFNRDDPATHVFVVVHGVVEAQATISPRYLQGQIFGELDALRDPEKGPFVRRANVVALDAGALLVAIPFDAVYAMRRELATHWYEVVVARYLHLNNMVPGGNNRATDSAFEVMIEIR